MRERELISKGCFSKGGTTIPKEERKTPLTQQPALESLRSIIFELILHIWIVARHTLGLSDDVAWKQCIQANCHKKNLEDLHRALKSDRHRKLMYPCDDSTT